MRFLAHEPDMTYFESPALRFLEDLTTHNDRDWFTAHKKHYETAIRDPFKRFIQDAIAECASREPVFEGLEPKHCIFRINRDTRFSKDKRPYKTHVSAAISPGGKKSGDPGLYLHFDAEKLMIGGGAYWVEKDDLHILREHIARHAQGFNAMLEHPRFAGTYGSLLGERNVRIAKELQAAAEVCPHVLNKQFYYMTELPASTILQDDLMPLVMDRFEAAAEVRAFLRSGLQAG